MPELPRSLPRPDDHDARLAHVRRVAAYEIGDASWASLLLLAYFDPERVEVPR